MTANTEKPTTRHKTNHRIESIERPTVNGMYTVYIIYKLHQFNYLHVFLIKYLRCPTHIHCCIHTKYFKNNNRSTVICTYTHVRK